MALSTLAAEQQIDATLYERIIKNNPALIEDLEKERLRLHRFNDNVVIAIAIDKPLDGKVGATYRAYPIDRAGKIHTDIHLIAKILHFPESQNQKFAHIQAETRNGNVLFSSSVAKIKNGAIILMSEVPGVSLLSLIGTSELNNLTALQRILLCINVPNPYKILHKKGIYHRDVTAGNILIDLDTLRAMPIDIDPSHQTELTQAPEKEASAQSDLFSIALDIFIPILSGVRPSRDTNGTLLNFREIEDGIIENFGELSDAVIELLAKLISDNPAERGTLEEAQQEFLYSIAPDILIPLLSGLYPDRDENGDATNTTEIEKAIRTNFGEKAIVLLTTLASDLPEDRKTLEVGQNAFKELERLIAARRENEMQQKNAKYDEQLRVLDSVLQDPQFKNRIPPEKNYNTYPHFHQVPRYSEPIEIPTPRLLTAP